MKSYKLNICREKKDGKLYRKSRLYGDEAGDTASLNVERLEDAANEVGVEVFSIAVIWNRVADTHSFEKT